MKQFIDQANTLGASRIPFFFMIDFEKKRPFILELSQCHENGIYYNVEGVTNVELDPMPHPEISFTSNPIGFDQYQEAFEKVSDAIHYGDTYLTNLCFPTRIETNLDLQGLFRFTKARFKLLINQQFMVFSPERFVQIGDGMISAYPMKGTIDAGIDNADQIILNDTKEIAEHATIVDLLRNDLNLVAARVKVEKYRYVEEIQSLNRGLLQVSSKIVGDLPSDYRSQIGTYLDRLTPAGSVSGAPKKRTLEVIRESEGIPRGYFTGVFGIFDGNRLNSGVMIRFLEQTQQGFRFWSGGGITSRSNVENEYLELIQKVYVPIY